MANEELPAWYVKLINLKKCPKCGTPIAITGCKVDFDLKEKCLRKELTYIMLGIAGRPTTKPICVKCGEDFLSESNGCETCNRLLASDPNKINPNLEILAPALRSIDANENKYYYNFVRCRQCGKCHVYGFYGDPWVKEHNFTQLLESKNSNELTHLLQICEWDTYFDQFYCDLLNSTLDSLYISYNGSKVHLKESDVITALGRALSAPNNRLKLFIAERLEHAANKGTDISSAIPNVVKAFYLSLPEIDKQPKSIEKIDLSERLRSALREFASKSKQNAQLVTNEIQKLKIDETLPNMEWMKKLVEECTSILKQN